MPITMQIEPAALRYAILVRPEPCTDGSVVYVAEIPDLPGCVSHGATIEEAVQNLEDAKAEYLAALQERGLPIPAPTSGAVGTVVWTFVEPGEEETAAAPVVSFSSSGTVLTPA